MPFELTCGKCKGRLRVPRFGIVVACPHCGVHLSVPDPDADDKTQDEHTTSTPAELEQPDANLPDSVSAGAPGEYFEAANMDEAAVEPGADGRDKGKIQEPVTTPARVNAGVSKLLFTIVASSSASALSAR